ncbi:hypothetical protein ABIF64_006412 [Bradyrhizobium japonicum]|jgi:hypothetical protein|nr:hypothetical protein [Bradyrhizobium japonicum]MCP1765760.1 hypothetical protein [Bradyrhizobium japonicum]MCP1787897.1 hypothetical protein [Bradyrhizobium japonicum]MCP1809773.1 hypothetical protein [Bradyrhizobium japonicum]MCP1818707.1 hypothetical protein [Bradyrhizobium japonicum]MCP1869783.1 hypothetical protein [Bradyrhizobium japonicum]
MDLKKEKNFFETRVIEYQNGGALAWEAIMAMPRACHLCLNGGTRTTAGG